MDDVMSIDDIVDGLELPGDLADPPAAPADPAVPAGSDVDPAQAPDTPAAPTESEGDEATPEEREAALQARLAELEEKEARWNAADQEKQAQEDAAQAAREQRQKDAAFQEEMKFLREVKAKLDEESPDVSKQLGPFVRTLYQRVQAAESRQTEQEQAIEAWVYATHRAIDPEAFDTIKDLAMGMSGVPRHEMVAYADGLLTERHQQIKTQTEQQAYVAKLERENAELRGGRPLDADSVDVLQSGAGAFGKPQDEWDIDDYVNFGSKGMDMVGQR